MGRRNKERIKRIKEGTEIALSIKRQGQLTKIPVHRFVPAKVWKKQVHE